MITGPFLRTANIGLNHELSAQMGLIHEPTFPAGLIHEDDLCESDPYYIFRSKEVLTLLRRYQNRHISFVVGLLEQRAVSTLGRNPLISLSNLSHEFCVSSEIRKLRKKTVIWKQNRFCQNRNGILPKRHCLSPHPRRFQRFVFVFRFRIVKKSER